MAEFNYTAIDKNGKQKKGTIEAEQKTAALAKLKSEGLTPVDIKEASAMTKDIQFTFGNLTSPRDLSIFCRQFVSMLSAGVTIMDALRMLADQTENKYLKKALGVVQQDIGKGETMTASMARHPKVFPELMINMVSAGEASGKLEVTFERMAVHFERSAKIKAMLKKAAVYPIVVAIVAVIVMCVMLIKVIPAYTTMFEELGMELPGITKMVVALSNFLVAHWVMILIVLVAAGIGLKMFFSTDFGKHIAGKIKVNIPIYKELEIKTAASLFARTLSTLVYAGMPLLDGTIIVMNTMENVLFKDALRKVIDEIKVGVPMSVPLSKEPLFPPMVGHMVKIGEETGDIESMLTKLADYYDEEVEMTTQSVMAALEPCIILVMAVIVGVLIGSVMAPMVTMYSDMQL